MKFGLKETTLQQIQSVLANYPQIEKAIIYGSRAKGNYKNGSDIDLTLLGGKELDYPVLFRIMDEIDDLLLPYTFDLSIFEHITDPDVIDHIQRVGVLFFEKQAEKVVDY